jgi:hypothetical protein
MNIISNITFDFTHVKEYWMFMVGIVSITTFTAVTLDVETMWITFGTTLGLALILKFWDLGTLPNIFSAYLVIAFVTMMYYLYNYIKFMDVEMDRLSKAIEFFGRESLYLDIVYSKDKIDAEYFLTYYKIRIVGDAEARKKYIDTMNSIIVPENIKTSEKGEICDRIIRLIKYIKSERVMVVNSIFMNGFKPSNSLIKFYIKLIGMKRAMLPNNQEVHDKFNQSVINVINRFGNKFKSEELIHMFNFNPIPEYKIDNEEFKILLNKSIGSIERYFDIYSRNNMFFM